MLARARALILTVGLLLGPVALAAAQAPAVLRADSLRTEWTVETTRAGRARVVGYLYNHDLQDAANVWVRVDQLGPDGEVAGRHRRRVVGDVLSGGRSVFDVPVPAASASYRVTVEAVDWVKECR